MIEGLLFVGVCVLIGRVLAELHKEHFDMSLTKYRVSVAEYRRRNQSIYKQEN